MNVLEQPNREILALLGKNPFFKNKKYRFNKYCLFHDYQGVKLIHNAFTRASVSMTNEELEKLNDLAKTFETDDWEFVEFLIECYFLVLEDYDETKEIDDIRAKKRKPIDDAYLKYVYEYILYPTTTCNARCFYCYEKPMSKMPMSMEMAEKVVKYILKKSPDKNRNIRLSWFGGEPLYNVKVMRYIMNSLKDAGRNYSSTIISNGYLFSDKMVEEAKNEWNLQHAQITLDGTEEVYNKAKNYIYTNQNEVSPFKKVIDNIERLTKNEIEVSIRMNVDMYNADNLKELIRFLGEKFKDNNYLNMYVYPIFEDEDKVRTDEEKKALFEKIFEIEDVMTECGFNNGSNSMGNDIRYHHCMVDGGNVLNIHPDGTLGLCEHYIDSDILGNIDEDVYDYDIIHSWRDYLTDELCQTCPIYPSCIRTRKCKDLKTCDIWMKEYRLRHARVDLEGTFNAFIERENNKCSNEGCCVGKYECAANEIDGSCYCVSQKCKDKENWCQCVSKKEREESNENCSANNTDGYCYCVSQKCEDKENWCYCISQKKKTEHKCEDGSCTCKKEESKSEEVIKVKKDKSFLDKLKDLFK